MKKLLKNCLIFALFFGFTKTYGQNIEFTLKYNEGADQYEVYALPDASNPTYFVGGGSQLSLVLPASIADLPLVITTVNGGLWTDNSRVFAPTVTPTVDYHSIASSGSFISLIAGQELLLYTFKLTPSGCIDGPRIFVNGSDPDSNQPGMAGGDFENYFPNLFTFVDGYAGTYDNAPLVCNTAPVITYAPDTTFMELDTNIVLDVITVDDGSMEGDSTLKYTLLGIDSAFFTIDSITGEIRFVNTPDFENPMDDGGNNVYDITVVVCDDASPILCDTQAVAITVTDYVHEGTISSACGEDIDWLVKPGTNGSYQTDIGGTGATTYGTGWWLGQGAFAFNNTGQGGEVTLVFANPIANLQLYIQAQQADDVVTFSVPAENVVQDQSPNHPTAGFPSLSGDGLTLSSNAPNNGIDWGVDTRVNFGDQPISTITISSSQGYNGTVLRAFNVDGTSAISCPNEVPLAIIDQAVTGENVATIINVQQNDLDYGAGDLISTVIGNSTQGVTPNVLNGDSISYTPPNNFTGIDTLIYKICYVSNPSACDTTLVLVTVSPDSDMDGISDVIDIDDDNDGIPDLDECPFIEVQFTLNPSISDSTKLIYEAMIHGNLETVTITPSTRSQSLLDSNNVVSPNGATLSTSLVEPIAMRDDTITEAALTFTPSLPVQSIRLEELSDMDRRTGDFPTDGFGFTVDGFWTVVTGDLASYDANTQQLITNNPDGTAEPSLTATNNSAHEMVQRGVISPILVRGTLGETNNSEVIFTAYTPFTEVDLIVEDLSLMGKRELIDNRSIVATITVGVPLCDVDGDNIPNYLDLDSDGDGCADAVEAGHLVPMQGDSTIAGDYGRNGLADAVETTIDSDTLNYIILADTSGNYEFLDSLMASGCNEAPVIVYAPDTTFVEGSTAIVMDIISTDDNSSEIDSTLTYSITGIDSTLFSVDSLTGQISFINPPIANNPLDYGKNNIYDINIIVCDNGIPALCDTQAVIIRVPYDRDGDGIDDLTDLDDDNDGILDTDECQPIDIDFRLNPSISDSTKLIYEAVINGNTESVTLTKSTNPISLKNGQGIPEPNGAILAVDGNNAIIRLTDNDSLEAALTFTSTYPMLIIKFEDLDDMDRKLGDLPSDAFGFNTLGKWNIITGDLASYDPSTGQLIQDNLTNNAEPDLTTTGDAGFEMVTKNNRSGILLRGTIGETNNAEAHFEAAAPFFETDFLNEDLSLNGVREFVTSNFNIQFITIGIAECDLDNDGIFNQFDLDSDGDGCPDAAEAGHGLSILPDSTIAGPFGENGLANSVETDDSKDATVNYTVTETQVDTSDFLNPNITIVCGQAPTAINDFRSIPENVSIVIDVQDNDVNYSGDTLITSIIGISTEGITPTILNGDSINYIPPTDFVGMDTFLYQICNQDIPPLCDTAMVIINIKKDTDGDGVEDDIDLDDDNDGIPDLIECVDVKTTNTAAFVDWQTFNTTQINGIMVIGMDTVNVTGTGRVNTFNANQITIPPGNTNVNGTANFFSNGTIFTPPLTTADAVGVTMAAGESFTFDFGGITLIDPIINIADIDNGRTISFGAPVTIISSNAQISLEPDGMGISSSTLAGAGTFQLQGQFSTITVTQTVGATDTDRFHFAAFGVVQNTVGFCDPDGDGISNQFDLDSDGDGCPDATEAGHNQVVQADSTIAGPYGKNGLAASVENSDSDTVMVNYSIAETNIGTFDFLDNQIKNGCDQITTLMLRVMLQGALIGSGDGNMRDDLGRGNHIPLDQPYVDSLNVHGRFNHIGGGNETTTPIILNANGGTPNAIVDWVYVELRDPLDSTIIFKTISALVQKDGDVVDAATGTPIVLTNPPLSFFVSVKHRNHLGAMKNSPIRTINDTATIDFTTMALADFFTMPGYENLAVTTESGKRALWAANASRDIKTKYDGTSNDRLIIGNDVLTDILNTERSLNYTNTLGYYQGDINMDGLVKYDGINNDRLILQSIIINYPLNFNNLMINNYNNMIEQLP